MSKRKEHIRVVNGKPVLVKEHAVKTKLGKEKLDTVREKREKLKQELSNLRKQEQEIWEQTLWSDLSEEDTERYRSVPSWIESKFPDKVRWKIENELWEIAEKVTGFSTNENTELINITGRTGNHGVNKEFFVLQGDILNITETKAGYTPNFLDLNSQIKRACDAIEIMSETKPGNHFKFLLNITKGEAVNTYQYFPYFQRENMEKNRLLIRKTQPDNNSDLAVDLNLISDYLLAIENKMIAAGETVEKMKFDVLETDEMQSMVWEEYTKYSLPFD